MTNIDISKYQDFFHDGSIIDIQNQNDNIIISMESAEIAGDWLQEKITLSPHKTLKGKLHFEQVETTTCYVDICYDEEPHYEKPVMLADCATILHMTVTATKFESIVEWNNFPPKKNIELDSGICIECKRIWWEHIPDLSDPFR